MPAPPRQSGNSSSHSSNRAPACRSLAMMATSSASCLSTSCSFATAVAWSRSTAMSCAVDRSSSRACQGHASCMTSSHGCKSVWEKGGGSAPVREPCSCCPNVAKPSLGVQRGQGVVKEGGGKLAKTQRDHRHMVLWSDAQNLSRRQHVRLR